MEEGGTRVLFSENIVYLDKSFKLFPVSSMTQNFWKLKVPLKNKHFMWKVISNCFPQKKMLRSKHVEGNVLCPSCNSVPKSINHILLQFSFSQCCWDKVNICSAVHEEDISTDWLINVFDDWDVGKRQSRVMLYWAIWKCRNDLVLSQTGLEVEEVVKLAKTVL